MTSRYEHLKQILEDFLLLSYDEVIKLISNMESWDLRPDWLSWSAWKRQTLDEMGIE